MISKRFIRIPLLVCISTIIFWLSFKREDKLIVLKNYHLTFINRYPKEQVTNYDNVMKNLNNFVVPSRLQSSIFFSLFILISVTIFLYLLSLSSFIAKFSIILYFTFMVICFILIKLGSIGIKYQFSIGLSHDIEDLFLSPLFVMALAVLVKAFGFSIDSPVNQKN